VSERTEMPFVKLNGKCEFYRTPFYFAQTFNRSYNAVSFC